MKWEADPPRHAWPQCVAITEAAALRSPENSAIWVGLAQTAFKLGREAEAVAPLLAAASRMPESAPVRGALARMLFAVDRYEEARAQVDAALRIDPRDRAARILDFLLLVKTGRWSDAAERIDDMLELNRLEPQLLEACWRAAADTGDLPAVLALCDTILAERPGHANAAYFRAFVLASLARDEEAREAMPTDRIAEIADLAVPPGFSHGDAFRAALRSEILANPTLVWNPRSKSTRGGARTRSLRQPDAPAVEALVGQIRSAVSAYVEQQSARSDAFARARPGQVRLDIWANVLRDDGYLMSHRHPSGWLSGVYYVSAPRPPGEGSYRGALLFGALDPKRDGIEPPWPVLRIEPVPGRLVLFPSYTPHATEATGDAGERISVAFDVIAS